MSLLWQAVSQLSMVAVVLATAAWAAAESAATVPGGMVSMGLVCLVLAGSPR